jgi:hypothetical protein
MMSFRSTTRGAPQRTRPRERPNHGPAPSRTQLRRLILPALLFAVAAPARAQTTEHPVLLRAITAYQTGDLPRAQSVLDSLPVSLPVRDQAVRYLYLGLVQFAFGQPARAQAAFARAIEIDPAVRLDPGIHAPSRMRAYLAALDSVVSEWRSQALVAEVAGDWAQASRQWARVSAAVPADSVARDRLAAANTRLTPSAAERQAGAGAAVPNPGAALDPRTAAADSTENAPARRIDPGQAAVLGMLVPGLGQIYAGKPGRGVLVLGAAAGALAFGLLHETISVECLSVPVNNFCPPADVVSEEADRPYLVPALGAALALSVIGAIDAFTAARGANRRAAEGARGESSVGAAGPRLEPPSLAATPSRIRFEIIRVRF